MLIATCRKWHIEKWRKHWRYDKPVAAIVRPRRPISACRPTLTKLLNHCSAYFLYSQPGHCSTPSWYSHLICCHPVSTTYISKYHHRSFRYASPHFRNQLRSRSDSLAYCTRLMVSHSSPTCSPLSPYVSHCFIPGSKLTFTTNLFHRSLLAPTCTAFSDYNWTGLRPTLLNSCFFFIFSYFFFLFWVVW